MKLKSVYFISHFGTDGAKVWDDDFKRWVPYGMRLYRSTYETLEECAKVCRKVKKKCPGWHDDIFVDSELTIA